MNKEEIMTEVLPMLTSYLNVLESDWQLHPIQATHAIYVTPEGQLQNQLDNLRSKREKEIKLRELINKLKS